MSSENSQIILPPHFSLAAKAPQRPHPVESTPETTQQQTVDFTTNAPTLPSPPFISVAGVPNFRDVGGYACSPIPPSTGPASIRRGYLFRCAQLSQVTDHGTSTLTMPVPEGLGIHHLYDLRSQPEITSLSAHFPKLDIPGIQRSFTPVYKDEDYSPVVLATKYGWYTAADEDAKDGYSRGFVKAYRDIANHAGPAYTAICRHIVERPDEPLIFHCTAGKDRTGVLAGLLLDLCGVDREVIAWEYSITESGLGEWRDTIIERLMKGGMGGGAQGKGMERDEAERIVGSRRGNMIVFLRDVVDGEFGGARSYFKRICGFTDQEVDTLRRNLVVEKEASVKPVPIGTGEMKEEGGTLGLSKDEGNVREQKTMLG